MLRVSPTFYMSPRNKIPTNSFFYKHMPIYFQQYFRPRKEEVNVIQVSDSELLMNKAVRFAQNDTSFCRVYPLIPDLNEEQRLKLAKIAIEKTPDLRTEYLNFARSTIENFQLSQESKKLIIKDLDLKTNNFVTESLKAQYGQK